MVKTFKIYGDTEVQYEYSEAQNAEVVRKIISFCEKYNIPSGESLVQNDNGQIYSPELVAEIIDDVLNFKAIYGDF